MTETGRRWDIDERGHGMADARAMAPYVDELRELVVASDWVTEDPEAHLLPHIRRALDGEIDATLTEARVGDDGTLQVDLRVPSATPAGRMREVAYRAVASIGETVTLVRQIGNGDDTAFEVVTGEVGTGSPSDTPSFGTHGHRVTIHIRSSAAR